MTREKNHTAPLPDWLSAFPELRRLIDPIWLAAVHAAKEASIPARTIVMRKGAPCEHCQLLAHGTLRVYEVADTVCPSRARIFWFLIPPDRPPTLMPMTQ